MAALRLVRKWGIPLATAAGAPLLVPVVRAEAGEAKEPPNAAPPTSRMVRPTDLPIYEEPEDVLDFEYHGRERTSLEEGVGVVRQQVEGIVEATRSTRERAVHIYETGKAHSMATVDYLTDEENMLPRAGAITVGGLAGLVIGARRRGGFFRKLLYTSTGVITAASLCYPRQAYAISQQLYGTAKSYGAIGYNFVAGVKPQSKAPPPPPPTEPPKETEKEEETTAAADTPLPPAPAPESEGAEVRSAVVLSLPPGKTLVDTLAEQASDVTVWGFRLTDPGGTTAPKATPSTVPEGFGSVGTAGVVDDSAKLVEGKVKGDTDGGSHTRQLSEGVREVESISKEGDEASLGEEVLEVVKEGADAIKEKVVEVEEKVSEIVEEGLETVQEGVCTIGKKVSEVEEKTSSAVVEVLSPVLGKEEAEEVVEGVEKVVGEATQELVETAADVVGEHVAPIVEEAAKQVEEGAAVVGGVAEVVEETGEKLELALGRAEKVISAAEEADKVFPVVPEAVVDRVEKVVEETETTVESITLAAKEVEGVAEQVKEEAGKVEEVAAEVMESKEKRKEVLEEVKELLEAKEEQFDVAEKPADSTPLSKEATPEEQTVVETPLAAPLTPQAEEREGLFDKLVSFFSKPSKGDMDSAKEAHTPTEATEITKSVSEEKPDLEPASGVPESSTLVGEKAESSTEADTHTKQLPESKDEVEGIPKGSDEASLGEEVLEVVKEGADAVRQKLEVEEKVSEMVEEGLETVQKEVLAVGEKVSKVEEKASSAVVEVLSPVLGKEGAKEVVEGVEKVVGEATQEMVETTADVVGECVAPMVEEAAKQVEEGAAVVGGVAEVVEETGEKVESALGQAEKVVSAAEEADKVFPVVPQALVDRVEKVVEETEATVESITLAAKEVEGVAEQVKKEVEKVEEVAAEVMESKEKGKEVLEEVEEFFEAKEKPADSTPISKEATPEDQMLVETSPAAPLTPQAERAQEREGLFDKLVSFLSKPSKSATDSAKEADTPAEVTDITKSVSEEKLDLEAASGVPESSTLVEDKAESSTEADTHSKQLPESKEDVDASLGEEVLEVVKEGADAVREKVIEVEEKVVEIVQEGVLSIGEKVHEVEEKASSAVVEVLSPVLGKEGAEEVVERVGEAVQELVEAAADVVGERVAPVVGEAAKEVEEGAAMVAGVAEVVEETGEKVESALGQAEKVASAAEEADKVFPVVPEAVVDRVKKVVEETEATVESITLAAKEVEGVAEQVKKEVEKVEEVAAEVMESKETGKEVLEQVEEFLEAKEHNFEVVEKPADSTPLSKEATPEDQTVVEASPAAQLTPQAEHTQEREGLFDKLVNFFSKPSKEEQTASEFSISSSVTQETQEMDVFKPESFISKPKAAETIELKENTPTETEGVTHVASEVTNTTEDEMHKKPEPEVTETVESKTTEVMGPETTEKAESEATEKHEIEIMKQSECESIGAPVDSLKGEKEQVVEEVVEKVQDVEAAAVGEELHLPVSADQSSQVAAREGSERVSPESGESQVPMPDTIPVPKEKEGLFDKLARLITKDSEKPASSSATVPSQEPVAAEGVPVPGEGESVIGTPVGEEEALTTSTPGNVLSQVDEMPIGSMDTSQVPDVLIVKVPEDTPQVPDVIVQAPDNTAQVPDVPPVPEETTQVPDVPLVSDVLPVPDDVTQASSSPVLGRELSPSEPGAEEALPGEVPGITLPQETDPAIGQAISGSEVVRSPADILDSKGMTEDIPLNETRSEPSAPLPLERRGLFDKLSSLFQKEQQKEPQSPQVPAAGVKEPLAESQEPVVKVEEDIPTGMEQEAHPAGEGVAVAAASEKEGSSVADVEESSPETPPAGVETAESVIPSGEKEEEVALPAAVETTATQPQVSGPQVQSSSMMGPELGQQPFIEISGEAPKSVDTAAPSMQGELGQPTITPPEGVQGQEESREPGTELHVVEADSVAPPGTELAKDTVVPSLGRVTPEGSQESGGPLSITSDGDTFIVRASPNRPSEIEAKGEDRWPGGKAGVAVRPSWSRTEATVVQEGKDVIVQLEPTTPEKDYGQSSPEDSDMYTTRG